MGSVLTELAVREKAVVFGRHGSLAGVLTFAATNEPRRPVLILGAGVIHKVGPSRASVTLARALAAGGHTALRFDLSGIGDSERAREAALRDAAVADIQDAISFLSQSTETTERGVCLVGYCSGADNALHVAADDQRVSLIGLFDPTVHQTEGFLRRKRITELTSLRYWINTLSGRNFARSLERAREPARPPGYYGLLVNSAEDTDARVRRFVSRGGRLLYVLSEGAGSYCNSPEQVRESLPTGYSPDHFTIEWRPDLNHILSGRYQAERLSELLKGWLGRMASDRTINAFAPPRTPPLPSKSP